ncbi:MAG: HupE/UreJ family protein [Phycisphaerales bacterium]
MNRVLVIIGAAMLLLGTASARAHDFGAMLVTIKVQDGGHVDGVIRVDPEHLPAAQASALNSKDETVRGAAIEAIGEAISRGAALNVDGSTEAKRLVLVRQQVPVSEEDATVRWSFSVPGVASSLMWRCDAPLGRYLLRVYHAGGEQAQWLDTGEASDLFDVLALVPPPGSSRVIADYVGLGFTHIIPHGLDHILFVLGLFLLSARVRPVLMQATAFTVAHSITLALAVSGVVSPPSSIVEPLIAASIAFIGLENVFVRRYTSRRTLVAFGFGLLHGLGFAGVLQEAGLPKGQLVTALISFNVGVELGQAAVILAAFALVGTWVGRRPWYQARVAAPASLTIAAVALVWTVERLGI